MIDPVSYLALEIPWQTFQTLTFKGELPPGAVRIKMLFRWQRAVAQSAGLHPDDLLMMAPTELGEKSGRFHIHPLLAGFSEPPKRPLRFAIMRLWQQSGGGFARCRRCGNATEAVEYAFKGLSQAQDEFETRRLNDTRASNVIVSKGVWKYVAMKRRTSNATRFETWSPEDPAPCRV